MGTLYVLIREISYNSFSNYILEENNSNQEYIDSE